MTPAADTTRARGLDRNSVLWVAGLMWAAVLGGFVPEIVAHVRQSGFTYPLIVHVHAFVFVGWLALFTVQAGLINTGRRALHRRLGWVLLGWAVAVVVVGPITALIVDGAEYAADHMPPLFLSIQFTDMAAFAGLTGVGFLSRRRPDVHRRLMLMGTIYLTDAGFGRLIGPLVMSHFPLNPLTFFSYVYAGPDLLMLAVGAYDLLTVRRLHPAYLAGLAYVAVNQAVALTLAFNPVWMRFAVTLIGH